MSSPNLKFKKVGETSIHCGLRILAVPDLKAMNSAIKNHFSEHKKTDYGLVFDSIEKFLTG